MSARSNGATCGSSTGGSSWPPGGIQTVTASACSVMRTAPCGNAAATQNRHHTSSWSRSGNAQPHTGSCSNAPANVTAIACRSFGVAARLSMRRDLTAPGRRRASSQALDTLRRMSEQERQRGPGGPGRRHRGQHPAALLGRARARTATSSSTTSWSASARCPTASSVTLSGIVTQVIGRQEGAQFASDVFLIADGVLPGETVEVAEITVSRVEPEIYVPAAARAPRRAGPTHAERDHALFFDDMEHRVPIGLGRDGEPLYAQPRVPRRHPRRARQHQRHLRRRHQDELRDVPALQPVPLGRARRRGRQHEGAHLQREGRGPPLPRPAQQQARRGAAGPVPHARAHAGPVRVGGGLRAAAQGRPERRARRRDPHHRRQHLLLDDRRLRGRASCSRSCSPTPRTSASSTRW